MCMQNLNFVPLPVPEIIGGTPKNGQSLDTPTLLFSKFFHGLLFRWSLLLFWPNLKFVALHVREIIRGTQNFGQSLRPYLQNY